MKFLKNLYLITLLLSMANTAVAQIMYTTKSEPITETSTDSISVQSLNGSVVAFSTLLDFQAAAPMATNSEDFETNIAGGVFASCTGDINSTTNNTCFTPGQIIDDINIFAPPMSDTVLLPPGFNLLTSSVLGALTFTDTTNIVFTSGDTQAFALDLYAGLFAADVDIMIFDTADALVDTITISGIDVLPDNQFIGIISPVNIGRINLATQMDGGELFDNLLFGQAVSDIIFKNGFE